MRKSFTKNELEAAFQKVGAILAKPLTVYLLGGGAMCFRNQKAGTKDLDLVFTSRECFRDFASAIEKIGFTEAKQVETEYADMMAAGIWRNKDDFRMDLFVNTVCRALSLSEKMVKRSELLSEYGNLVVKLVSNEDVILFKGITERPDDTNDIAAIIRRSDINWGTVFEECVAQSKSTPWYGLLADKFADIEKRHKISVPIAGKILELDRQLLMRDALEMRLKKGMSRKEAINDLLAMGFSKKELGGL